MTILNCEFLYRLSSECSPVGVWLIPCCPRRRAFHAAPIGRGTDRREGSAAANRTLAPRRPWASECAGRLCPGSRRTTSFRWLTSAVSREILVMLLTWGRLSYPRTQTPDRVSVRECG